MASVVTWPKIKSLNLPEFVMDIPEDLEKGRIEIYKVPRCNTYPEGYFVALNTSDSYYHNVEPGCASWEKVRLARISIAGKSASDSENDKGGNRNHIVEYLHPDVKLDLDALNPKEGE